MCNFSTPRIKKGSGPKCVLHNSNYRRRALPYLRVDFNQRCAYSMRHWILAGGESQMEVDHFNPRLKGQARHRYKNLFLASRVCNNAKSDSWPTAREAAAGIRLIDPTVEGDYGVQIFEDPITHELVGTTPAARYHIDIMDLNAESFFDERRCRSAAAKLMKTRPARISGDLSQAREAIRVVLQLIERWIPPIPAPPAGQTSSAPAQLPHPVLPASGVSTT